MMAAPPMAAPMMMGGWPMQGPHMAATMAPGMAATMAPGMATAMMQPPVPNFMPQPQWGATMQQQGMQFPFGAQAQQQGMQYPSFNNGMGRFA